MWLPLVTYRFFFFFWQRCFSWKLDRIWVKAANNTQVKPVTMKCTSFAVIGIGVAHGELPWQRKTICTARTAVPEAVYRLLLPLGVSCLPLVSMDSFPFLKLPSDMLQLSCALEVSSVRLWRNSDFSGAVCANLNVRLWKKHVGRQTNIFGCCIAT